MDDRWRTSAAKSQSPIAVLYDQLKPVASVLHQLSASLQYLTPDQDDQTLKELLREYEDHEYGPDNLLGYVRNLDDLEDDLKNALAATKKAMSLARKIPRYKQRADTMTSP